MGRHQFQKIIRRQQPCRIEASNHEDGSYIRILKGTGGYDFLPLCTVDRVAGIVVTVAAAIAVD